MNKYLKFIISLVIPLVVGFIGSLFTRSSVNDWYVTLKKPAFNPPNYLFGPVWSLLFILMGISFYLIWSKNETINVSKSVYLIFFIQLFLNLLWSVFLFGLKNPLIAFF